MSLLISDNVIENAIKQYSGLIVRIAFCYARNKADSEDIMQDVFITLINQPPFETEKHLKAWLIRVTINKSKNFLKSARRRYSAELKEDYVFAPQDNMVFDALNQLPEKDRNVLYLFYYEGYTAKEIGAILKKKEGAVTMILTRAREKMKNILEE